MNRAIHFLIILIITLSSCIKHTEIVYEAIDFKDSYWLSYEVDGKKLEEGEELFIFNFTEYKSLNILLLNPNNNQFETKYTFSCTDIKDNTAIIDGYFLSSLEYKEATLYYKKLDSEANNMEFKLKLSPESNYITIKMNKLEKKNNKDLSIYSRKI